MNCRNGGALPFGEKSMSVAETYLPEVAPGFEKVVDDKPFQLRPIKALRALGRLLKDKEDTAQVFEIMRHLSGRSVPNGYAQLLKTPAGGAIAFRHQELAEILSDRDYLSRLPEGSVGRAYLNFTTTENISAQGLIEESRKGIDDGIDSAHPHAWYARRMRDIHDLWHVLSGYGRDALGEASLVAFSYAQTRSLGFGLIAIAGALKLRQEVPNLPSFKVIWEAYRRGRKAAWLPGEDYVKLLAEPLSAARARLNIARPVAYDAVPADLKSALGATMVPA
jgi:ubiquinone biosynthesis protein COQ4